MLLPLTRAAMVCAWLAVDAIAVVAIAAATAMGAIFIFMGVLPLAEPGSISSRGSYGRRRCGFSRQDSRIREDGKARSRLRRATGSPCRVSGAQLWAPRPVRDV